MTRDEYIETHIGPEAPHLARLYRATQLGRLYPRMCSDHPQGRTLAMLVALAAPKRIVELGTFSGYSAICMAEAMAAGGRLDTIELDPEYASDIEATFAQSSRCADIHLHIGDAEEILPLLASDGHGQIDFIFIDANKRRYPQYYRLAMEILPVGGVIIADNTLWADKVLDPAATDPQTEGLRQFNRLVALDARAEKTIIPTRDGMTIIRKISSF